MIYSLPGQNCAFGDSFRITYTGLSGTLVESRKIIGDTSGAHALIRVINTTLGYIDCTSLKGTFVVGETFKTYTSTLLGGDVLNAGPIEATISAVSEYTPGRGQIFLAGGSITSEDYFQGLYGYDLSDSSRATPAPASTTIVIVLDRFAATFLTSDPTMMLLSGVSFPYDYRANTSRLSSIVVTMDTAANFPSPTTLVSSFGNGSPTDGFGSFGQGQIFCKFATTATERYIKITFTVTADTDEIGIGNLWIGEGIDTLVTERWNMQDGFTLQNIDRGRYTELEGGGFSRVQRQPYRRYDVNARFNRKSWHMFLDAVEGRADELIDDPSHPWVFALDPDNYARLVTGQHALSGLFRVDGSPSARDTGAWAADGTYFLPEFPISLREVR